MIYLVLLKAFKTSSIILVLAMDRGEHTTLLCVLALSDVHRKGEKLRQFPKGLIDRVLSSLCKCYKHMNEFLKMSFKPLKGHQGYEKLHEHSPTAEEHF